MRLTEPRLGHRYYGCRNRELLGKSECTNDSRYRQDVIEAAMLHRFGLGWLDATPATQPVGDIEKLIAEHAKLRKREKDLEAAPTDLSVIRKALTAIRPKVADALTRLNAAQQQAALAKEVVKIADMTDRAEIAAVLKKRLMAVLFTADYNQVTIETQSHVLTVTARQDGGKAVLAVKGSGKPVRRVQTGGKVEITWNYKRR